MFGVEQMNDKILKLMVDGCFITAVQVTNGNYSICLSDYLIRVRDFLHAYLAVMYNFQFITIAEMDYILVAYTYAFLKELKI